MAGDVPVWPDNMALMTVKGGCLQHGAKDLETDFAPRRPVFCAVIAAAGRQITADKFVP